MLGCDFKIGIKRNRKIKCKEIFEVRRDLYVPIRKAGSAIDIVDKLP